ncbi:MAG TPA: MATE family efflux transporter, partial [Desulfoprunum sp.]|nr:MATE family efflux transporter [Desulfoprunum sp.]
MLQTISNWRRRSRYHDVVRVCLPLVASMSATTVMEFTDRAFLANYSLEAISAAAPAGITAFLFMAFFGGVGSYAGVFIAQYSGSGAHRQIGRVLWQGIYFTLFSGLIFWFLSLFAAGPLFRLAGHSPEVQVLERIYFDILCRGAVLHVAVATLSTFFAGRGMTRPVMLSALLGMVVNIPLDYALIFGRWGLPEMGIAGAAIATVCAWEVSFLLLSLLIFTPEHDRRFAVLSNRGFSPEIFSRLMRFGIPGSLQFSIDILAFTFFILLVGRIGTIELAATNIVLSINALAFMPSMGVSQGVSVLVGQALGARQPQQAKAVVWSGIHLLLVYIAIVDLLFILFPQAILAPFLAAARDPAAGGAVLAIAVPILRIVSAYLFFDALYMVFSGVLKGAGDTRFIMVSIGLASVLCLILPVSVGIAAFGMGIIGAWLCVLIFV